MKLPVTAPAAMAATFLVSLVLGLAAPAAAQPPPGAAYLRASAGVTTQWLKDFNDSLKDFQKNANGNGIPLQWDTFGPAFHPRGEIGYVINDMIAVGVEVAYQESKINNYYEDAAGSIEDDLKTTLFEVAGNVSYRIPTVPGLFVGVNAGVGSAKLTEKFRSRDFADTTNNLKEDGSWDGTGPIGGVFAGYERGFGPGLLLFARGGYEYRNVGHLDGTLTSTVADPKHGPVRGQNGKALNADFSGLYVGAGLGFSFGGSRK